MVSGAAMRLRPTPATPTSRRTPSRHARRRPAPPLLFHGWLVVTGAFLVLMAGYGAAYSYAAFAAELEAAFGASRTSVSMAPCCMGRRYGHNEPKPCFGSCDADVIRTSEVKHSVQQASHDGHLGGPPPARLRT
jgi:hypothetical protein